ncbi:hypothetical protein BTH42_15650 [Burkholderia sp. SRS-W-2-2016]|uniref:hypothetical protein n=1 Tax=Burkholderia sp. SRS-W-2-2016 TaxID=1926878 RepID=UPI00094ACC4B|nr:hypothetical protein [Burkholderia sp. SRS-W-2-2016]OLL30762.1 hypothetical protein BTH42_15650 [Burkholderia sp. SRS-W-2-2016]
MTLFRSLATTVPKLLAAGVLLAPLPAAFAQGVLVPQAEQGPRNSVVQAASAIGAKQCLPALSELSALGIKGTTGNDVLFDWDRARGGNSAIFSLVGLEAANGNAAMSLTGVPEADGTCSVSAERISVEPADCATVARKQLPGYQGTKLLSHMMVYTDGKTPGSSVSLIDSKPGCLMIRRFVMFRKAPQ